MNKLIIISSATILFFLIDLYVFQAVKTSTQHLSPNTQNIVKYIYWGFNILVISGLWLYNFVSPDLLGKNIRTFLLVSVFISYLSKVFIVLFLLIDDLQRLVRWVVSFFTKSTDAVPIAGEIAQNNGIPRSEFLMKTALVVGTVPAVALTWGIISGAHDYRIRKVKLSLKNLPKAFDGLRIAQISDIHTGSFFNKIAVKGGIDMLLDQKPDMIFFTGDLVNNEASEVNQYIDIFNKLKAPLGVFSTLGNHDYGD
jgi:hypothetical protein